MAYVLFFASEKVVQAQDVMTFVHQTITEVGAEKSGTTGNQDTSGIVFLTCSSQNVT